MMLIEKIRGLLPARWHERHPLVPVLRFSGPIGMSPPLRPGLFLSTLAGPLDRAFRVRNAVAVAIVINSPGGSAAQSHLIYKRIRDLSQEHDRPVYAFIEDVGASGGYMLALAADEIVADPSSIVGSIGVIAATFGFDKAIDKLGIERRIYTAGENKSMLDPFLEEKPEDVRRLKALQKDIHGMFIDIVKTRRGDALKGSERRLFTGEFWSGTKALELGLVDRLGDLRGVLKERFGEKVRMVPIATTRGGLLRRLRPAAALDIGLPEIGIGPAAEMLSAIEARALWSRYGL